MKTATVEDLPNCFTAVSEWIRQGETVKLTQSGRVIARIVPEPPDTARVFERPDFAAIQRKILGDNPKVYPSIVEDERKSYQW